MNCRPIYFLNAVMEDGSEYEVDYPATNDSHAILIAKTVCAGTEGLWSAITLVREDGQEIAEPSEGWR